eukprot:16434018-Heterocapsa_arctica.AAC.1
MMPEPPRCTQLLHRPLEDLGNGQRDLSCAECTARHTWITAKNLFTIQMQTAPRRRIRSAKHDNPDTTDTGSSSSASSASSADSTSSV